MGEECPTITNRLKQAFVPHTSLRGIRAAEKSDGGFYSDGLSLSIGRLPD